MVNELFTNNSILNQPTDTHLGFLVPGSLKGLSQYDSKANNKSCPRYIHSLAHYGNQFIRKKIPSYIFLPQLCSYIMHRCISSAVNSSVFYRIIAGVPQRSVLALIIFLLHINDLLTSNSTSYLMPVM